MVSSILHGEFQSVGLASLEAGFHTYGNGFSLEQVRSHFTDRLESLDEDPTLIDKFHLTFFLEKETGGTGWGNHAKFFAIDDEVLYIGSQNLYACNLQEFGMVIDDKTAVKEALESYFNPLWS